MQQWGPGWMRRTHLLLHVNEMIWNLWGVGGLECIRWSHCWKTDEEKRESLAKSPLQVKMDCDGADGLGRGKPMRGWGGFRRGGRWGGGGLSRGQLALARRERRQSPALGAPLQCKASEVVAVQCASGRWGEAVGPGSSLPPPSAVSQV